VNARIDYCNTVLVGAPRTVTDKLQRVLNAAAHVVNGTRKFDRGLDQILRDELHLLEVPDRVFFKRAVLVHRCLNGRARPYLSDYCSLVANAAIRQHLRSANGQLFAYLATVSTLTAAVPFQSPAPRSGTFSRDPTRRLLKTYLFARY